MVPDPVTKQAWRHSQFRGCILGGAVGDALGMPTEEGPSRQPGMSIELACGQPWVDDYIDSPNPQFLKAGQYTDDTQQTICLAETLLEGTGQFDPLIFLQKLQAAITDQARGIGPSTHRVLMALATGQVQQLLDGECASENPTNGGAMRIAPLALVYHHDLEALRIQVKAVTSLTHSHERAVAGACVQAYLIATRIGHPPAAFDPVATRRGLVTFIEPMDPGLAELLSAPLQYGFGNTCEIDDTIPPVVDAFLGESADYAQGVLAQVNADGDTDTKASMLGNVLGAHLGFNAIPSRYVQGLENGLKGRDYLLRLADALYLLSERQNGG